MKKKVLVVAGARPNFMKIAPLLRQFRKAGSGYAPMFVHTGQHYDFEMSEVMLQNLRIPPPDICLNVGSGSHGVQTAKIMLAFEGVTSTYKPHLVVVVGDVNSTLACSLVAAKANIPLAHVEAGLRSGDRTMPEEINRMVTDSLSDYLFASEESGLLNLRKEGINSKRVHFVGNIMIDTLSANLPLIEQSEIIQTLGLSSGDFCVLTLHRPSNVDSAETLLEIFDIIKSIPESLRVVYPIHPRARAMLEKHGLLESFQALNRLVLIDPLGYIDFIRLVRDCKFVLTDSGGIQEETTFLEVPCLTMRDNTERPITVSKGTNHLVGRDKEKILGCINDIMLDKAKEGQRPELWDGKTAKRITTILSRG